MLHLHHAGRGVKFKVIKGHQVFEWVLRQLEAFALTLEASKYHPVGLIIYYAFS